MKREEINTLLIEWERYKKAKWYHSDAVDVEAFLMDEFARMKSLSFPPAEGAESEETKEMAAIFNLEQKLDIPMKDRFHNSAKGKALFDAIYGKPQPAAEGAEEILAKHGFFLMAHKDSNEEVRKVFIEPVLAAMNDFTALHAQRLADKMVSERLREELIKFVNKPFIFNELLYGSKEKAIDEYLKSISHE